MKYTIHGFSQEKLIEAGLDNDDALILSVIKDMYSSKNMQFQIIDGERFIWIDQGYLLEQIPIIGSPRKLRTKIKSYCDNGFLERRLIFNKDGVKGKFSYVNVTIRLDELVNSNISNTLGKNCLRLGNNSLRVRQNSPNKDSLIRDSINISKDILSSTYVQRVIDEWNSIGLQKIISVNAGTNRYKSLKARINEYGIEKVIQAIKNINNSSFLKGQNDKNWTINFDWLVKPNNFIKVLEGNYTDKKGVNRNDFCSTRQNFSQCERKEPKYDYNKINGI